MRKFNREKIKYFFLIVLTVFFSYGWINSPRNMGGNGKVEILKLDKDLSEINFSPKFIKEEPVERAYKIENSRITFSFYSILSNEDVHKYFFDELKKNGWIFFESRTYGYFGIKRLGVKTIDIYCKGRHKIYIEHLNKKNSKNLNQYGFSISWSLYEEEDCLGNPA